MRSKEKEKKRSIRKPFSHALTWRIFVFRVAAAITVSFPKSSRILTYPILRSFRFRYVLVNCLLFKGVIYP